MKYLILALTLTLLSSEANAAKFETKTLTADGTVAIASIPRTDWWKATFKSYGDFGGGTLTLWHSSSSACTSMNAVRDLVGAAYSSTDDDMLNLEIGVDKNNYTYLCATLAGATSPSIALSVYDNR